jgi:peptidyl-prolyl cis-trans isomerase A (cyclophilin A)
MNFDRSRSWRSLSARALRTFAFSCLVWGCSEKTEALDVQETPEGAPGPGASPALAAPLEEELPAKRTASVAVTQGDPEQGEYTIDEALQGLTGEGVLMASIKTDRGEIECELLPERAPITVANFVGLARGTRPWKEGSQWVEKPFYDGKETPKKTGPSAPRVPPS